MVLAYINKGEAPDWLKTHYDFLIRTFWIGLAFSFIGFVLMFVVIGFLVLIFTVVWWIIRCVQGLMLLQKSQAIPKPQTWLFT